jgi:tricarballylate dehydrogenase
VRFQPPLGGTLNLGKTNAFFLGGGRGMLNALYRKAEDLGVVCVYDAPVIALTMAISSRRRSNRGDARRSCAEKRWLPRRAASKPISIG